MTVNREFYLSGKDYLNQSEAAHYCCVSESQFKRKRHDYGIGYLLFMGKHVLRKSDLKDAIEGKRRR